MYGKTMIAMLGAGSVWLGATMPTAHAAPLDVTSPHLRALETFNYTAGGSLEGNNGGTGWDGAWFDTAGAGDLTPYVEAPNFETWPGIFGTTNLPLALRQSDGLVARLQPFEARRDIAGDPIGVAGETVWFSSLVLRATGESLTYLRLLDGTDQAVSISLPASHGSSVTLRTTTSTSTTGNVSGMKRGVWTIARIDYADAGNGDIYLWVLDEDDFAAGLDLATWTPSVASATAVLNVTDGSLGQFDRVEIARNDGSQRIDRIHLHVIPEPASLSLLCLGGVAMLTRRGVTRG